MKHFLKQQLAAAAFEKESLADLRNVSANRQTEGITLVIFKSLTNAKGFPFKQLRTYLSNIIINGGMQKYNE
jgi:hypothetical protein